MLKHDSATIELLDPVEPDTLREVPGPVAACGCGCGCYCPGSGQQNDKNANTAAEENINFIAVSMFGCDPNEEG